MRLLAAIIDTLILMIVIIPVQISMGIYDGFPDKIVPPDLTTTLLLGAIFMFAYVLINSYTWHKFGQSLGKLVCKIKIVRADFNRVELSQIIFARYIPITLIGQIPMIGWVFSLVDALFIFRKDRQCLHDKIADTIVIKI